MGSVMPIVNDCAAAARDLAALGLPVFPCNADKSPKVRWKEAATSDPEQVASLWARNPNALIGLPTGSASGIFVVDLDVDKETGEAVGEAALAKLGCAGLLNSGPVVETPSGGRHLYFRHPGEGCRNSGNRIGNKVDTRGDGGYVIAPGSVGPQGAYVLRNGPLDPESLPDLPEAIRQALAPKKPFIVDIRRNESHDRASRAELEDILSYVSPDCCYSDWVDVLMGLHDHFDGSAEGLAIADAWSAAGVTYKPKEVADKWHGFTAGGGISWGTVCSMARSNGADLSDIARKHRGRPDAPPNPFVEPVKATRQSAFYCPTQWQGKPVPPREWLVTDLIPSKTVTLFSGDGGTGKSLAALQLAISVATDKAWLNMPTKPGRVILISAEDDDDELHRRFDDILRAYGKTYSDLGNITMRSLAGEDALLAVETNVALAQTALFSEIEDTASEADPALIILDTLADLYPANENDRAKVRQFVGMLRGLALRRNCAVLLLGHPSLTGLSSGTGTSGSTAWNNSVRSRLYLSRIVEDGYEPDPDRRVLTTKKANYGRIGGETHLTWTDGVFVADQSPSGLDRLAANAKAERIFLSILTDFEAQGRHVSASPGPTYAPKVFEQHPKAEGITKRAFRPAMEGLLHRGKVVIAKHGSGAKERSHLVIADG